MSECVDVRAVTCMRRGTVGGAFVPPFVPRCMRVARGACVFMGNVPVPCGNLLRFVVVAMVVAKEV